MAQMNGRVKAIVDFDPKVILRPLGDGAETANANETAIETDVLDKAYWQTDGEQSHKQMAVNVFISDADFADTDETYAINIVVDDASDFASKQTVLTFNVTGTGYQQQYLNMDYVASLFANPVTHMRAELVVGGTTPSIDYFAWLSPIPSQG